MIDQSGPDVRSFLRSDSQQQQNFLRSVICNYSLLTSPKRTGADFGGLQNIGLEFLLQRTERFEARSTDCASRCPHACSA